MNWLERARCEIERTPASTTADSDDRNPTAVMPVIEHIGCGRWPHSNGSIGSAPILEMHDAKALRGDFEERAAIMEFDGGMSRMDAECAAGALALKLRRLN